MTEYTIDGNFTAKLATVQTKATGNPTGHLTASPGDYIVEFPFDCGGAYSGHNFQIVVPSDVFHKQFKEVAKRSHHKKKDSDG